MSKSQNGFSVVEVLLFVVITGLVVGVGAWVYMQRNADDSSKSQTPKSSTQESAKTDTQKAASSSEAQGSQATGAKIYDVDIRMKTEADVSKLPAYTPASFKTYLATVLRDNKPFDHSDTDSETTTEYRISKISAVNIQGGTVPVDTAGEVQSGGAPAIWVLAPNGSWDKETLNGPRCTSKNGGKVYVEFVKECSIDYEAGANWVANPNGSITSIAN